MNTPETSAEWRRLQVKDGRYSEDVTYGDLAHGMCRFAKKLETERNEARKQRDEYMEGWQLECECRDMYRKQRDELLAALVQLRDCDFVISLPDRMDAVREIARQAIANVKGETA